MAFNQQSISEQDLLQVVRQNQVRTDETLTDLQRKLQQQAEENARLRGMLNDTATRTESRIDSLLGDKSGGQVWEDDDWAASFGGSPREKKSQSAPQGTPSDADIARIVEQKIYDREVRQQQQIEQSRVQENRDGQRLWNKFLAEHPDLAQDKLAVLRLHQNWAAAKELNSLAAPNNKLDSDQLYTRVVTHLRQQTAAEAQYAAMQAQQQSQQQGSLGPFESRRHRAEEFQGGGQFQMGAPQRVPQNPVPVGNAQPPTHQQAQVDRAQMYPSGGTPIPNNGAPQGSQAGGFNRGPSGDTQYDGRYAEFQAKKFRRP